MDMDVWGYWIYGSYARQEHGKIVSDIAQLYNGLYRLYNTTNIVVTCHRFHSAAHHQTLLSKHRCPQGKLLRGAGV